LQIQAANRKKGGLASLPSEGAMAMSEEALGGAAKAKCLFCGSPPGLLFGQAKSDKGR